MSINCVAISGNLTRDPEVRSTKDGMMVATLPMAVNDRRKDADGNWQDFPNYIDVTVFGKRFESTVQKLSKGSGLFVQGKLRWSQWESDGQKRSKIEVIADEVVLQKAQQQVKQQAYYPDDCPF